MIEHANTFIDMPRGSTVLSVQAQNGKISLWMLVNPESVITEKRLFETYCTGELIGYTPGQKREFLGTCQFFDSTLVMHVFERIT